MGPEEPVSLEGLQLLSSSPQQPGPALVLDSGERPFLSKRAQDIQSVAPSKRPDTAVAREEP